MNFIHRKNFINHLSVLLFSALTITSLGSAQILWTEHMIHAYTYGTASIYVSDLDNDGDKDVLGAVLEENQMVWWRNEGGHPIAWTKFTIGSNFFNPYSVYAADIDNDGDQDVIGAGDGDEIAWWSNNGGNPIQWSKHTIRNGYDFAHEVYAHDFDEDGDMDVFGTSTDLDLISWWRNDGGNPIQWTEFNIDSYFTGAHRVQIIDLDGDQDPDILAAGYLLGQIAWYSNDGGDPIQWTKQIIGANFHGACIAHAADFDDDGDLDVAGSAQVSSQLAWWRNGGGNPIVWTKYFIDEYFYRAWPMYVCDLDQDNDPDVVAASSWQGTNEVEWFENIGTGITENRTANSPSKNIGPTIISSSAMLHLGPEKRIYDITGREINPDYLAPGIYLMETEDHTIQKVIRID